MASGEELFGDLPEQARPERDRGAGAPRLRQPARDQVELRAVDLDSLLSADHLARVIWRYVEALDLQALYDPIKAREGVVGHPTIDPRLMLALWLYATSEGIGSARALARLCESHDAYRWLCGGVSVNHHTLGDFRLAHPGVLDELLAKNVAALAAAGLIDLDELMQDGIRVRAAAGASSFRRRETVEDRLRQARAAVERLKKEVDEEPQANEQRIKAARERAAREREARAAREREARAAAALEKLAEFEAQREQREKKKGKEKDRGKTPRVSLTDPEARIIKMPDGGFRPAYNMQIVTAGEGQIVVAVEVTASGADAGLARPMLEALHRRGVRPARYLADGGFTKNDDIEWAHGQGVELYCPAPKTKHNVDPYTPRKEDGPGLRHWRERMASEAGQAIYRRRPLHECINARFRQSGLTQIAVRGLGKARTILRWHALANNVRAAHRLAAAAAT
jgi:transposase